MKTATAYRPARPNVAFPNAATRTEMLHKFLDSLLLIASGVGIFAMILFILLI